MTAYRSLSGNEATRVSVDDDYRGPDASTRLTAFTANPGTNDNDLMYELADASMFNGTYVECTAGVVDLEVSIDGTNYNATPPAVLLLDATAVGTYTATIAAGKIGFFPHKVKGFRIRQNGAVASAARVSHVWK